MIDLHTCRIKQTGDIQWLGKTYGELKGISSVKVTKVSSDNACIGMKRLIDDTIVWLWKLGFDLKVMDNFTDYLSCEILFSKDKSKAWVGQPHLVQKLEKKFADLVKGLKNYKTPGTPGHNIVCPTSITITTKKSIFIPLT